MSEHILNAETIKGLGKYEDSKEVGVTYQSS